MVGPNRSLGGILKEKRNVWERKGGDFLDGVGKKGVSNENTNLLGDSRSQKPANKNKPEKGRRYSLSQILEKGGGHRIPSPTLISN